ncbi:MAG: hypothetical protein U0163_15390 [Gemmatimonadaceae bacterium]
MPFRLLRQWGALLLGATGLACSATQPVRVLTRNERRWIASAGGPLLPNHVPTGVIPYTTVGTMWGARDNLTLSANAHVLAAAFGIAGVDVGAASRLTPQRGLRPEVTSQLQLYGFVGDGGSRLYPNLTANASWSLGRHTLAYAGSALTLGTGTPSLVATPLVGVQRDATRHVVVQLEGKWMAANVDTRHGLFEGENTVSGHGGLAAQLGLQWRR